jgi:hypothetical protein
MILSTEALPRKSRLAALLDHFAEVEDPRDVRRILHPLPEVRISSDGPGRSPMSGCMHDGGAAARAVRRGGQRASSSGQPRAVRPAPGPRPQGSPGLRDRPRHQQLFGPVAPGRGDGRGPGSRRPCHRAPCRQGRGGPPSLRGAPTMDHRITDRAHLAGLVGAEPTQEAPASTSPPALLRPLAEYEAVAGGGW